MILSGACAKRFLWCFGSFLFPLLVSAQTASSESPANADQIARGKRLYAQYCFMCHQGSGLGAPGVFPPLAKSDFLAGDPDPSIRGLVAGLTGKILVNGVEYNGVMPPAPFNDEQIADVLTFARNNWGNSGSAISIDQVKNIRAQTAPASATALVDPNPFAPLPKAPPGFALRELVRLPNHPTRLASDHLGKKLYVLCVNGDVWRVQLPDGRLQQVLSGDTYINQKRGEVNTVGLALDAQNRFYIVVNQRYEGGALVTNECTIFRTTTQQYGEPVAPKPWLETRYPWGIGPFNHGVGHIAIGPDGFIYINSGSRTDGSEPGQDPRYWTGGEHEFTACIWRIDPRSPKPQIEIFARGVRNAYGFCWNDQGEMFATDNGPDADAPEELNQIERGKHYGFPYQFSNWTNKPYAYTPDPPAGTKFTLPIANLGPDAGFAGEPVYTFDPHSSPAGIVFLGNDFPEGYRGTLLTVRFGNLLKKPRDVGFDLLQLRLQKNRGTYAARVTTLLSPLARPVDVHLGAPGKIYICEYSRMLDNKGDIGMLPGRVLELAVQR
jgi:glucose/arabinose dehydrogenase/mono/diheme cytochrome c family protein